MQSHCGITETGSFAELWRPGGDGRSGGEAGGAALWGNAAFGSDRPCHVVRHAHGPQLGNSAGPLSVVVVTETPRILT